MTISASITVDSIVRVKYSRRRPPNSSPQVSRSLPSCRANGVLLLPNCRFASDPSLHLPASYSPSPVLRTASRTLPETLIGLKSVPAAKSRKTVRFLSRHRDWPCPGLDLDEGMRLTPISVGGRKGGLGRDGVANGCRIDIIKRGSTEVEGRDCHMR